MKIETVPIGDLKFADYNPRKITDKQVEDLKASIDKFGLVEPVVVNKHEGRENIIVGGHQRVRILQILGYKEVPVFYVDLDEVAERELNIRLNKNNGEWDWDKLANEFAVEDLRQYGFTNSELGIAEGADVIDTDDLSKTMDSYLDGNIKQVVLFFDNETYEPFLKRLDAIMTREGVNNHTEAVLAAIKVYEGIHTAQ